MTGKPAVAVPPLVLDLMGRSGHILILPHRNPDGDALGSARALALALGSAGRRVDLALLGEWDQNLSFLLADLSIVDFPDDFSAFDLIVLLDFNSLSRLERPGFEAFPAAGPPIVVIDHHPLRAGEKIKENWFLEPTASSAGELIWHLLSALDLKPSPEARDALLLAIASDTGFFSQNNTTAAALRAAADMVEMGAYLEMIRRRLYADLPLRRLKLMGLALDSLKLYCDGRVAVMALTPDTFKAAGATQADNEGIVELGRNLANVTLSALVTVKDWGVAPRVSLRSQEPVDASALAQHFGGGGHRLAAAYNDSAAATVEEAVTNLLARVESFL